jgi:hypothetical protein
VVTYVDTKITLARKIDRERNNVPTNNLSALWFSNRNYYFFSISLFYLPIISVFVRLISHQPAVLFSLDKPATSNQPAVLFSQNKSAPAISHQPNEQAEY